MTATHRFVCLGESPEDQAKCRFYRPFAENDAWCENSYGHNGEFSDLCRLPTEAQDALKWEREADALRIENGHLRDRISQLEGKR